MSWIDVPGIAEYLGLSVHTVWKKVERGEIPFGRAGRRLLFNVEEVDTWVRSQGTRRHVKSQISVDESITEDVGNLVGETPNTATIEID